MRTKDKSQIQHHLRITDVARLCGISASTLRLWERHRLLHPEYSPGGQRLYGDADLSRIRDIRRLRSVQGLSLAAIRALLSAPPGQDKDASSRTQGPPGRADDIGSKLRALRKLAGKSLRQVSAETGLAASLISTLERTSLGASAASLKALAHCYGTTVTDLVMPPEAEEILEPGTVIRSEEARQLPLLGAGIKVEQLVRIHSMMDCQRWTLAAGAESDGAYSHEGEEFIYILSGTLEITLDGCDTQQLACGDSIYFQSTRMHAWRNPGNETAVLLWVNTPPSF